MPLRKSVSSIACLLLLGTAEASAQASRRFDTVESLAGEYSRNDQITRFEITGDTIRITVINSGDARGWNAGDVVASGLRFVRHERNDDRLDTYVYSANCNARGKEYGQWVNYPKPCEVKFLFHHSDPRPEFTSEPLSFTVGWGTSSGIRYFPKPGDLREPSPLPLPAATPQSRRASAPARPQTSTATPAMPTATGPTVNEADAQRAVQLAEQRNADLAAQRAATDRLNAEVARQDAETVARNRAKDEQFAREQAEHRRQMAAVEAETARIRAENEARLSAYADARKAWEAQVAACNRGDRAACAGQTPAAPAGPRTAYWFIYAVNGEHVAFEPARMMTATEVQAEEAMLLRLAPGRFGAGVRVLKVPVPRADQCSQLYLEGPADKTYNLKTGPRNYIESSLADKIRLWSARPVSSIVCHG